MSPRTGRPKSDNTMTKSIKIRFDDDLYDKMTDYCTENAATYAELVRRAVKTFLSEK